MDTPCLAKRWESKRGNERGVETQEVKGCSFKMVRKAQNQGGSRRPKRKYEILVAYPDSYKERSTTRRVKLGEDTMCRQTCPVKCVAYFSGVAFNMFRGSKLLANA